MKHFFTLFFVFLCTAFLSSCGTLRWGASRTETKKIQTEQNNEYYIDNNGGKKINVEYSMSTTEYFFNY